MFKVKNRNYYINEKVVKSVYRKGDKFIAILDTHEKVEIEEYDYLNLGGKLWVNKKSTY